MNDVRSEPQRGTGPKPSGRFLTSVLGAPVIALVGVGVGVPAVLLLLYSFRNSTFLGVSPGYTLDGYRDVFGSEADRRILLRSLAIGFGVAALTTVIAFVTAMGITFRLGRRAGPVVLGVVIAASVAGFLVRIFAWGTILGTGGLVNRGLEGLGLIDEPITWLFFGYFAIVVTMVYVYLPVAVLMIHSAMQGIDPRSLEASYDLGMGRWRTALRVVAPQARTGIAGAFVVTAILAASDYVTPSLVGGARGLMTGRLIRDAALNAGDYPQAGALAYMFIVALVLALAVTALLARVAGPLLMLLRRGADALGAAAVRTSPPVFARFSLSRIVALVVASYLVVPTILVLLFSLNSGRSVGLPLEGLTVDWYARAASDASFKDALVNSAVLAASTGLLAVIFGVPAAFARQSSGRGLKAVLGTAAFAPYVVPGVLIGTAISALAARNIIGTGLLTTMAMHVILATPLVILVVGARLGGLDPRLGEAARDLGSSPARALRTVTAPLIAPAVLGAGCLAVALSLDEIVITSFTAGESETVPTYIFGQARRGFTPAINAIGIMLMAGTLLFFAIGATALRRTTR